MRFAATRNKQKLNTHERTARSGKELWGFLKIRLRLLVSFEAVWGKFNDLYPTRLESQAEDEGPLPSGIFDPDATFAIWWNLVQLVALIYVAIFVPMRVGFGNEPDPFTVVWFIEACIDLYFLTDIFINFRVAYYDGTTGSRVTDTKEIAVQYLKTWFPIDILGILPISYLGLMTEGVVTAEQRAAGGGDMGAAGDIKALKILRLFRLAKMLRLRKLKEVLKRFEEQGLDVNLVIETGVTLIIIGMAAHVLACIYYLIGTMDETTNGIEVQGWVTNKGTELNWHWMKPGVGTQYMVALSMAMRQEWTFTENEHLFSVFANLIIGLIYGALDALIITVFMNANAGDQIKLEQEASLRAWIGARHLDRRMQALIMNNFASRYKHRGIFDEKEIVAALPPQLKRKVRLQLYLKSVDRMPFFKELGFEVNSVAVNL